MRQFTYFYDIGKGIRTLVDSDYSLLYVLADIAKYVGYRNPNAFPNQFTGAKQKEAIACIGRNNCTRSVVAWCATFEEISYEAFYRKYPRFILRAALPLVYEIEELSHEEIELAIDAECMRLNIRKFSPKRPINEFLL